MSSNATDEGQTSKRKEKVPSYARPNVASMLPEYTNHTAESIRAAFVPNSFTSLASLRDGPNDLAPFRVGATNATFGDFVYECSPYDLSDEDQAKQRRDHEAKIHAIAGPQPFFAGYSTWKAKFEEAVPEYLSEPYDGEREEARQRKFLDDAKHLSKPFVPPGVEKALQRPTRTLLGDAMTALYRIIAEDWPEAQPTILSTAEDLIVVYFLVERLKNTSGVLTYMNNALRRNEAVLQYDLRKVQEGWNVQTEDRHLMFTLRPPWVRARSFLPSETSDSKPTSKGQQQ